MPNGGNQQTCSAVADFDGDGINDFAIGERSQTPSVCLYLRNAGDWKKYIIDNEPRNPEAGACTLDVDNTYSTYTLPLQSSTATIAIDFVF